MDIYNAEGKRLRLVCDVRAAEELGQLRFAIPEPGALPPGVYVILTDRVKGREYRSNTVPVPGR